MRPTLILRMLVLALALLALASGTAAAQPASSPPPKSGLRIFERFTVTLPQDWRKGPTTRSSVELFVPRTPGRPGIVENEKDDKPAFVISVDAGMLVTLEVRRDHAEALRRLAEIASEQPEKATMSVVAGWPAVERRYRARMPQPGETVGAGNVETWFSTVAVAAGVRLVRFETTLAPDADLKLLDEAEAIARSLVAPGGNRATAERELPEVTRQIKSPPAPGGGESSQPGGGEKTAGGRGHGKDAGVATLVHAGVGELEVASSNDGSHVVVAANSGFSFSDDFGAHWSAVAPTPCTLASCDGDPSLAVGQSGAFYYSWIGGPTAATRGDGISRSTDNGHTFPFRGVAVACPGVSNCSVADQEHIAADRANAGMTGDLVYNVWRNFTVMGGGAFSIRIVCSQDGGANWGAQQVIGAGDFPRVSVGSDGFVYTTWASGGNMMLNKFSNCDAGLAVQPGFPVTAAAFTNVVCPVPGLDRCNGRNILSSPVVSVDDQDANHLYYVFATSTGAGNENVMAFDSSDGGLTFPRSVRVNGAAAGRRFMPWISTYGGVAAVSWYDRRNATAANNDRTRFFIGSVALHGTHLLAGPELDLSGTDDAHCATWPCATNATTDSEGCSAQPQLAGGCSAAAPAPFGSVPCDFTTGPACAPGLACNVGRGCPKFGDYNGNAAMAGRHYSAWSSGTPPVGVVGAPAGINVYTSADLLPSDFFVRDWTNSATDHDRGQQPSTNPTFWATSDVWNQSTNVAAPFPASDWILGDPGDRTGSNFAFARVSRRAAAATTAGNVDVTVDFMQADYGLGTMFTSAGTETVTFAAGDVTKVTPGHAWTVSATASNHLCLAAQITAPNDDFDPPSLTTTAPGPANAMIVNDNNKAQRNLADTIGSAGSFGTAEILAIIRNAYIRPRPMEIGIRWPIPRSLPATVEVVGGPRVSLREARGHASIRLGEMKPGEEKWLRLRVQPASKAPVLVSFFDAGGPGKLPSNGFSVRVARGELRDVASRNLRLFGDMLLRMAALEKDEEAQKEGEAARAAARESGFSTSGYVKYMKEHREAASRIVERHLKSAGGDPFDAAKAWKDVGAGLQTGNAAAVASAQNAVTERLEAHMTSAVRKR